VVVTEVGLVGVAWVVVGGALNFTLSLPAEARGVQLRLLGRAGTLLLNGAPQATTACGRYQCCELGPGPAALTGSMELA
jgi:hypothetical protein